MAAIGPSTPAEFPVPIVRAVEISLRKMVLALMYPPSRFTLRKNLVKP